MNRPLLKYSKLVDLKYKIILYMSFILLCSLVGFIYGYIIPLVPMGTIKMMMLPIFFIALVGIWAMPEKDEFLENKVRFGFFIFLMFWCMWPEYLSLIKLPGDPWMSPQRILIYILLLMSLIMFSVSKSSKNTLYNNFINNRMIFILVLVFMFASLISIFFSKTIEFSTTYFIKDLMFNFLVFFIASTLITKEEHLKVIFKICIFSAIILSLMAFYENSLNQTIWAHHLPRGMFAANEEVQKILTPMFRFGDYRVKGSSLTSLEYAELLSYILPMCLYYFLENKNTFIKFMMVIAIVLIFYAIVVSRSRLGLVGAIVSISNYSFIISIRYWRLNKHSLIGPALLVMYPAGLIAFGLLIGFSTTLSSMILGGSGHAGSTNARPEMWIKGLPMVAERPFFGYGLNMGASTLNYTTQGGFLTIDTFILQIMLETGLIGGVAFVLIFLFGSFQTSKVYINSKSDDGFGKMGAAIASILLAFIVIKIVLSQRSNHPLLFLLLGVITNYYVTTYKNKDAKLTT